MKKRNESEWRALFAAHEESSLTAAVFCREHGLCPKYFSLRKRQLGWHPGKGKSPFVVVQKRQTERQTVTDADIRLRYQGMEILIPATSPQLAVEVIRGLL